MQLNQPFTGTDNKEHQLRVFSPFGGGGYHVYIDNYFVGQIVPCNGQWEAALNTGGSLLSSDDIGAILDMINNKDLP